MAKRLKLVFSVIDADTRETILDTQQTIIRFSDEGRLFCGRKADEQAQKIKELYEGAPEDREHDEAMAFAVENTRDEWISAPVMAAADIMGRFIIPKIKTYVSE